MFAELEDRGVVRSPGGALRDSRHVVSRRGRDSAEHADHHADRRDRRGLPLAQPRAAREPAFVAGQAITTVVSPDGMTLLVLTSGYNQNVDSTGAVIPSQSNEYISRLRPLVGCAPPEAGATGAEYIRRGRIRSRQPDLLRFGRRRRDVHVFALGNAGWAESGTLIGLVTGPRATGYSRTSRFRQRREPRGGGSRPHRRRRQARRGRLRNDAISVIDVASRTKTFELDEARARFDPAQAGVAGGEFPFWVTVAGNGTAYVSSIRDREVVVVDIRRGTQGRRAYPRAGQPEPDAPQPRAERCSSWPPRTPTRSTSIDTASNRSSTASRPRRPSV